VVFDNKPGSWQQKSKANYDRISQWYDLLAGPFERPYISRGLEKLAAREGELILEIGFGTGYGLQVLAQSVGSSGKVCGIDISEGMCHIARSRLRKASLLERVELHCDDALNMPFKTGRFDAVFMSFTLELFADSDMGRVLRECLRVMQVDGRLGVVALSTRDPPSLMAKAYEWARQRFPDWIDCRFIPVISIIQENGFRVDKSEQLSAFGLPIEIVVAKRIIGFTGPVDIQNGRAVMYLEREKERNGGCAR
jgi:ubiquinone/menaquinone biosynthesis C-methylase UbiE